MVIVKISGGLGNQLFQYSFGQYVSKLLNVSVKYDLQTNISMNSFTVRDIGLMNFNFDIEVASIDEIKKFKSFSKNVLSRLERKLIQKIPIISKSYYVENKLHNVIYSNSNFIKDNCYYDGYWQSFTYLDENKELLISQISLKKESVGNEQLIESISLTNSISLHIRRGDYISIKKNSDIFHVCSLDYYKTAIDFIEQKVSNPQYFIFSDDIEWAKQNFIGSQYFFVEGNEPHVDMYLMSLCKHNIIANSTFSWWGAWLNSNFNNVVIAPKLWYVGEQNNNVNNFIPNQWIRI